MSEFYLTLLTTLIGAVIGFLGAIVGAIIAENRKAKKELKEFYSWVASLLYRLLVKKEIEKVREDLTTQTLHYTFNRLWARVPQKDKELEVRDLIFRFLKGGDELDRIIEDEKFGRLRGWLEKRSK